MSVLNLNLFLLIVASRVVSKEIIMEALKTNNEDVVDVKIVGGENAHLTSYQISLRDNKDNHICGGSIITKFWIITAAHCITEDNYKIVVGAIDLKYGGYHYLISRKIKHASFSENTLQNDIALIKTVKEIVFNKLVQPIKLASYDITTDGITMFVTGWGFIATSGPVSNQLKKLAAHSVNLNMCKNKYKSVGRNIYDTMLCTFSGKGRGTCFGDSGGPLIVNNELHGIVCTGQPCAISFPDVFTRVYSYLDWIKYHINSSKN